MDKIYRARRKRARRTVADRRNLFRSRLTSLLTLALFASVLAVFAVFLTSFLVYRSYANDLRPPQEVIDENTIGSSIVYDRNGTKLYEYFPEFANLRDPVPLNEISPYLIAATIATEDSSFYGNPGVNFKGLARAAWENLTPFGPGLFEGSGGSSITQQLARNVYIEYDERSARGRTGAERKIKETVIALELKQNYSDGQILEWYLNQIFYGNNAIGAEAAARQFFGKGAAELTLAEASLLAGLPQRPSFYDPSNPANQELAKQRQNDVLDLMIDHIEEVNSIPTAGDENTPLLTLTVEEIEAARQEPLVYSNPTVDILAPHWVVFIRDQVEKMCAAGLFEAPGGMPCDRVVQQGGLRITSTLDLGLNAIGQQIIEEELARTEASYGGHNGSLVAIKPQTGEILAYVGSRDYNNVDIDGSVDIASSLQSHGSTMKMFTYLKAFEDGWVPSTYVEDKKLLLDVGGTQREVNNWNFSHKGTITARTGLAESINTVAVRTLMDVGEDRMRELAHRMGITDLRQGDCGPTITLGACEVKLVDQTFAYAVLANNGMMVGRPTSEDLPTGYRELDQVSVLTITDSDGNPIYEFGEPQGVPVVDPAHAYMITDILSRDAITWSRLSIDRPAATKTGTSEEFRDGLLLGYTPDLAAGVWMGNADNSPMAEGTFSSVGSGPIWRRFMEEAHSYLQIPPRPFDVPDSVLTAQCGGRTEVFKEDTPVVKNGACRGPAGGGGGATATPSPRGPVFPTNTPSPAPTEVVTATPEPPSVFYYTVRPGDTIEFIAELFAVSLEDLLRVNGLTENSQIFQGDILVIPDQELNDEAEAGAEAAILPDSPS
ncbi:MAG TPA: transglycosylase domain-containing protein [Dehalococcoidia bacterium]|nr:transglycosylase domain-containing protein [Dehalococcoidia bacterium]